MQPIQGKRQLEGSKYLFKQQWPKHEQNPDKNISAQSTSESCIFLFYEERNVDAY